MQEHSPFDASRLQAELTEWRVEYHLSIDSTNRYALAKADHFRMPTVIVAEQQTAGKGRGQNRWWSTAGALTFSLAIRPLQWQITPPEMPLLSLITAAAVRETLCLSDLVIPEQIQLKWPNDIYLQNRKVCGILLEQSPVEPEVLVIGIGLNVNNSWEDAPDDLRFKGIALCDVQQEHLSREDILKNFLQKFTALLKDPSARQRLLTNDWKQFHLLDGQIVALQQGETIISGVCEGIDEDGALLIRDMYSLHRVRSGVVLGWGESS